MKYVELNKIAYIDPKLPDIHNITNVSFVPMSSISDSSFEIIDKFQKPFLEVNKGYTFFFNNDVLIAKITPCFENGKLAIANIDTEFGFGSTEFYVLHPIKNQIDHRYLYYYLRRPALRIIGEMKMQGSAGQKRIPRWFIENLKIPLPPLPVQRRIAEVLDRAERIRRLRQRAIEKMDELIRSTFLEMFGDPVRNPMGYPLVELFKLGVVTTGSTPSSKLNGMFGDEIPFITPGDLESNESPKRFLTKAGSLESRTVRAGSTLVCCIGATVGKTNITKVFSAFNQQINAVSWNEKIDDYYGFYALSQSRSKVINRAISTTLPILKKSLFQKITIPVPPINLQNQFALIFHNISDQLEQLRSVKCKYDSLVNSLLQRAFRGELEFNDEAFAALENPQ